MVTLTIKLEGEGALSDWVQDPNEIIQIGNGSELRLLLLKGGMSSGRHSAAFAFKLPDGRVVMAETSAALLRTALRLVEAKVQQDEQEMQLRVDELKPDAGKSGG